MIIFEILKYQPTILHLLVQTSFILKSMGHGSSLSFTKYTSDVHFFKHKNESEQNILLSYQQQNSNKYRLMEFFNIRKCSN